MKIDIEQKLILAIIKGMFCPDKNNKELSELIGSHVINHGRVKELMAYHDITPFAYRALKDFYSSLPKDLREFLTNNYYCALVRCLKIWQEFLRILTAFEQEKVTILPLKGAALLADIYKKLPIRPMADMDLLVKEQDIQKAEKILCGLGYRKELYGLKEEYWREDQCHIAFCGEQTSAFLAELHWSLDFKRKNRVILPEIWQRIRQVSIDGKAINLLSLEDTVFSLILHNRRHGKTLNLKNSYDLILLLNNYASGLDWNYILSQSRKYELNTALFFSFCQAGLLSDLNIPAYVWESLNLPAWKAKLIRKFIIRNTFLPDKVAQNKHLYLKSHFLLYDSFQEPVEYIINIPKEQFAKFYCLTAYDKKTEFLYKHRLFYMFFKAILLTGSAVLRKNTNRYNTM